MVELTRDGKRVDALEHCQLDVKNMREKRSAYRRILANLWFCIRVYYDEQILLSNIPISV